ncbi:hypothetical protein ES708_11841 [subsurface metagenome]
MEIKMHIKDIENLRTSTGVKVEKDKDGEVIDRKLVTKVQFEAEVDPTALSNIHRLLASESPVHVVIGSPQAAMEMVELEHAFAEK